MKTTIFNLKNLHFRNINMAKTRRKPKITTKTSCPNQEDLISRLPDEVLTHILSYIDTRCAIATTILSKRWNGLWISVPNLDFGLFRSRGTSGFTVTEAQFANFIDRVLSLNNVLSVRNIFLDFGGSVKADRLNSWITSIAKRDAEKINLCLGLNRVYCLPDSFFNKKNLVELQFPNLISKIPESVCFPSLKTIRFRNYQLNDYDSLKNLLFGCQVLTDLFISILYCDDVYMLNISSSTLRVLELRVFDWYNSHNVIIDAPNLRHLTLYDNFGESNYDIRNVSSLVNVNLFFEEEGEVLFKLLSKLSHVYELFLSILQANALTGSLANMPMFHNLIKLTLKIPAFDHWLCSFRIFHCTPNLVTCVILLNDKSSTRCSWDEPIEVPHCFSSCLESIQVPVFLEGGPKEDEMQMITYILKNAIVLKTLYIEGQNRVNLEQENVFLKKLRTLHKSSAACEVSYEVTSSSW